MLQDEVEGVIETMDEYFLDKEDWDALVELGVGERAEQAILKKIPSSVKSTFTRTSVQLECFPSALPMINLTLSIPSCLTVGSYNKTDHPIAFHKGTLLPTSKKIAAGPKADQEDVHEVSPTFLSSSFHDLLNLRAACSR